MNIPELDAFSRARANTGAKVRGRRLNGEVFPIGDVLPEPIFGSGEEFIKVRKVGGDDNTLRNVQFEVGEKVCLVKNWFDNFQKLETAKGSANVICTSSHNAVRGFPIGRLHLILKGLQETKERVSSNRKNEASRRAALDDTSQNQIENKLSTLGKIDSKIVMK